MKYVEEEETTQIVEEEEYGCPYCWNKKKKQEIAGASIRRIAYE